MSMFSELTLGPLGPGNPITPGCPLDPDGPGGPVRPSCPGAPYNKDDQTPEHVVL